MDQCPALNTSLADAQEKLQSAGIYAVKEARDVRLHVVQLERREGNCLQVSQTESKGESGLVYRQSDCKEGREGTCLQTVRL